MINRLIRFLQLTRPLFLLGGAMLFCLGTLIAIRAGFPLAPLPFLTGQLMVTSTQLMTHYINEYFDQESDRLNERRTWFSGGSGVLASGSLPPTVPLCAAQVCLAGALLFLILTGFQAPVIFLVGGLAIFGGWFYSAPPLALVGSGWDEVVASLVVAGFTPLVGYLAQTGGQFSSGQSSPIILLVCLCLGLIHLAMPVAFEIPDYPADRAAGKRTLAVRLGLEKAARLHSLALIAAFGLTLLLGWQAIPAARFTWLLLPVILYQIVRFPHYLKGETRSFWPLTFRALALFAGSAALWLAGFIL